jgi:hypothetical protein
VDTLDVAVDVISVIWHCFEIGRYTHGEAMQAITHSGVHDILPIIGSDIIELCKDIRQEVL